MMFSRKVFWGATSPRLPPGILLPYWLPRAAWPSQANFPPWLQMSIFSYHIIPHSSTYVGNNSIGNAPSVARTGARQDWARGPRSLAPSHRPPPSSQIATWNIQLSNMYSKQFVIADPNSDDCVWNSPIAIGSISNNFCSCIWPKEIACFSEINASRQLSTGLISQLWRHKNSEKFIPFHNLDFNLMFVFIIIKLWIHNES